MKYNITVKEIYNILKSSDEILRIYKEIENYEIKNKGWAFHNYEHVENVSNIAEKILIDLNFDENTIYKCKIACILHDVGALYGKEGHAQRSYEFAKNFFDDNGWNFEGKDSVLDAIKNHSCNFETDDIVSLSIILADKLDIKKNRITEEGKKIKGNRQYGHIENILINIKDKILTINFITDGNMIIEEVNNYYFTAKVFKAIETFTNKLNLDYHILMDNNLWNL